MAKMKHNVGNLVSGKIWSVFFVQMRVNNYARSTPVGQKIIGQKLIISFFKNRSYNSL